MSKMSQWTGDSVINIDKGGTVENMKDKIRKNRNRNVLNDL